MLRPLTLALALTATGFAAPQSPPALPSPEAMAKAWARLVERQSTRQRIGPEHEVVARIAARLEAKDGSPERTEEVLDAPFTVPQLMRAKAERARVLLHLLEAMQAPDELGLWLGGEDHVVPTRYLPWARLSVALVATPTVPEETLEELQEKLEEALEPPKGMLAMIKTVETPAIPGKVTYVAEPAGDGVKTTLAALKADPTMLARRLLEEDGRLLDWPPLAPALFLAAPLTPASVPDPVLLEVRFPELRQLIAEEAHRTAVAEILASPVALAAVVPPLIALRKAFWVDHDSTAKALLAVSEWKEALSTDLTPPQKALLEAAAAEFDRRAEEVDRRGQIKELLAKKEATFAEALQKIRTLYPDPGADPSTRIAGRDLALAQLVEGRAGTLAELAGAGELFSGLKGHPWHRFLEVLSRTLDAAPADERDQWRERAAPAVMVALVKRESRTRKGAELVDAVGFWPFTSVRELAWPRVPLGKTPPLESRELKGKIMQCFWERAVPGGLFWNRSESTRADGALMENGLTDLLARPLDPVSYLTLRELIRLHPMSDPLDDGGLALQHAHRLETSGLPGAAGIAGRVRLPDERLMEELGPMAARAGDDETAQKECRALSSRLQRLLDHRIAEDELRALTAGPDLEGVRVRVLDLFPLLAREPREGLQRVLRIRADLRRSVEDPLLEQATLRLALLRVDLALARLAWGLSASLDNLPALDSQHLDDSRAELLVSIGNGLYADGLIDGEELGTFESELGRYLAREDRAGPSDWKTLARGLESVFEWAHANVDRAFGESLRRAQKALPDGALGFREHVLESSTLVLLERQVNPPARPRAAVAPAGSGDPAAGHQIAGKRFFTVRGVTAGLASGELAFLDGSAPPMAVTTAPAPIVALEEVRSDVGSAAGLIFRSAGSSLSRLQHLARNLGVPSAVVSGEAWQALRTLESRRVSFQVSPDRVVTIEDIARAPSAATATVAAPGRSRLDPPDREARQAIPMSTLRLDQKPRRAGPKATYLAELRSRGMESLVPEGLVLPFGLLHSVLDKAGVDGKIADLIEKETKLTPAQISGQLAEIRKAIQKISIPRPLARELASSIKKTFGERGVFVRSDSNVEYLPGLAGGGLEETVPNVIGTDKVIDAVRQVWASAFSERAWSWRRALVENPQDLASSVLLMPSIDARKAGVLVTRDIVRSDPDGFFITAHDGLGIKVADGSETPEELVFHPTSGAVDYHRFSKAREKLVLSAKGGVESQPRPPQGKVLEQGEIRDLAMVAMRVKEVLAFLPEKDFEIEWILDDKGAVKILEVRPFLEGAAHRR